MRFVLFCLQEDQNKLQKFAFMYFMLLYFVLGYAD